MSREKNQERQDTYVCLFAEQCDCPVKFRIFASEAIIKFETQGEHTTESHVQDKVTRSVPQSAAIQQMVSTNPRANSSTVRRGLDLLPESAVKISPSKLLVRLVQRAVSKARARTLEPFTQGEDLKGEEGSLVGLSKKIYLQTLVEQHNLGGKHLDLHQPVCLGFQYSDGVIFGNYSTPMLLHTRAVVSMRAGRGKQASIQPLG
jgi:hypothetical protein